MSGGQEKNFSTLGPKLRGNKAQQDYGDKQRQICIEVIDYLEKKEIQRQEKYWLAPSYTEACTLPPRARHGHRISRGQL